MKNNTYLKNIINNEIITNQSTLIETYLFKMVSYDPYEVANNLFYTTDEEALAMGFDSLEEMQESGEDARTIFEWWQVSEYLYNKLNDINAVTLEVPELGQYFWGRQETGQSLILDSELNKIAK